jgi:uracil-DNA glycosylase
MNRRVLITKMVSGLLGTLVLPARLRQHILRPKPIPEVDLHLTSDVVTADINMLKRKLVMALGIPAEYLEPSLTNITETLVRHKDSLWRGKK